MPSYHQEPEDDAELAGDQESEEDADPYEEAFQEGMALLQKRLDVVTNALRKSSIYKVPQALCDADRQSYTPIYAKIGCYFIEGEVLPFKIKYLKPFLDRAQRSNLDLSSLLNIAIEKDRQIRDYHADSIPYLNHDRVKLESPKGVARILYSFTENLLANSAFLIELLRRNKYNNNNNNIPSLHGELDPQLSREVSARMSEILRDILLLENQLPFFFIKELYWLVYTPCPGRGSPYLTDLVCEFLGLDDRSKVEIDPETNEARSHHLLDMVRSYYAPSKKIIIDLEIDYRKRRYIVSPTATAPYEAGVKFKVAIVDDKSELLDIHFDKLKGILTMPKLSTEDPSMTLFKNMMAYEQCMQSFDSNYITDYHYFLDCLINTPRDVELLADAGIVENCLGCEAICEMFNGISKNTMINWRSYIYGELSEQLNDHCKYNWNRHKASLKNKYFGHPWALVSLIYASILLVLTLVQVATGILAVPGVLN